MYSSQTTESAFNSIAPYVLAALIIGVVFVVIMIIFFVKIWNACTDIRDLKQMYNETHPIIIDEKAQKRSTTIKENDKIEV